MQSIANTVTLQLKAEQMGPIFLYVHTGTEYEP